MFPIRVWNSFLVVMSCFVISKTPYLKIFCKMHLQIKIINEIKLCAIDLEKKMIKFSETSWQQKGGNGKTYFWAGDYLLKEYRC